MFKFFKKKTKNSGCSTCKYFDNNGAGLELSESVFGDSHFMCNYDEIKLQKYNHITGFHSEPVLCTVKNKKGYCPYWSKKDDTTRKLVYIAGAYAGDKENNVKKAQKALEFFLNSYDDFLIPILPHNLFINTNSDKTEDWFYHATIEIMKRCDYVFVMQTEETKVSKGVRLEIEIAGELEIPVRGLVFQGE